MMSLFTSRCLLCSRIIRHVCQRHYVGRHSYEIDSNLPRITVPHAMIKQIERRKKRQLIRDAKSGRPDHDSPILISCKNRDKNHYKGQIYKNFNNNVLASSSWKGRRSADDHFTILPIGKNPSSRQAEYRDAEFTDYSLNDGLLKSLNEMNIQKPTTIQNLAIPLILSGENIICAAETGSGKTLAYLLPILELFHRQEKLMDSDQQRVFAPRAIVMTPSRELAEQITGVADKLSLHSDFTTYPMYKQSKNPYSDMMDVLIGTSGAIHKVIRSRKLDASRLQFVVLDEADTLLDDSFNLEIRTMLEDLAIPVGFPSGHEAFVNSGVQMMMVSATMPRDVKQILGDIIPIENFVEVKTNELHRLLPHVPQKFIKLKPSQKMEAVMKMAKKNDLAGIPTMIFCNKSDTSLWLSKTLEDNNVNNILLNSFGQGRRGKFQKYQDEFCNIIVCTDLASRGLDTIRVQHVINYECPTHMSDYIHRAGRVGRMQSQKPGHVCTLVTYDDEVELLWEIETAARTKKGELTDVNANIKRTIDAKMKEYDQQHQNIREID